MIRSVFVFELYVLAHEFDLKTVLKAIISKTLGSDVLLMICIDSKSLYDCLMKLEITNEKRLMIDVMSLRQSYKRREITEMRWIKEENNPADLIIKTKPCSALKTLIDINKINLIASE